MKLILVFDGGATTTRAGLYDFEGVLLAEAEGGPSNPVDLGVNGSVTALEELARYLTEDAEGEVEAVVAALAGAGHPQLRDELGPLLAREFDVRTAVVASDSLSLASANLHRHAGAVVIAGTGSVIMVRTKAGGIVQFGGRGAVFGDPGSAYRIAESALRAAALAVDGAGPETTLTEALCKAAHVQHFDDFKVWSGDAAKRDVAALAPAVSRCADAGDAEAQRCVREQAGELAAAVAGALRRSNLAGASPRVLVHGGVFANCADFRTAFDAALQAKLPDVTPQPVSLAGHAAAVRLAFVESLPKGAQVYEGTPVPPLAPTEHRLESDKHIDELTALEIVELMNREDGRAVNAVTQAKKDIAAGIDLVARAFAQGGRLIYVGAGTSGRLGALDAAECPPTFGVNPEQVVAVIAGGDAALHTSVEGAEDNTEQALADMQRVAPAAQDVVCGIASSGTTPYVRAALEEAARAGATTLLVCCNPSIIDGATHLIRLDTGPEVLAGSTRLKAGTATKMVLNQLTTGAMTLSGYVFDGLMVQVQPVNAKLRQRAVRIVQELTGLNESDAAACLRAAGDRIPVAVVMQRLNLPADAAAKRLEQSRGMLRAALRTS